MKKQKMKLIGARLLAGKVKKPLPTPVPPPPFFTFLQILKTPTPPPPFFNKIKLANFRDQKIRVNKRTKIIDHRSSLASRKEE